MASQLRVNKSENRSGLGTITYTDTGAIVSGIVTANSFSGDIIGNITGAVTATTGSFSGDVSIAEKIIHTGDTNTFMKFDTDTVTFETAGDERIRITSSGLVLIGTDSGRNTRLGTNNFSGLLQIESDSEAATTIARFNNGAGSSRLVLQKARGTKDSPSVVQSGDDCGQILFSAWDGDSFTNAANITVEVDGTPGDDDMPGRLMFSTTPDGTTTSQERLRINSTGQLELRKNQNGVTGRPENRIVFRDLDSSVAANQPIGEISWYSTDAGMVNVNSYIRGINEATNGSGALLFGVKAAGSSEIEALRITSDGTVGINVTNPDSTFKLDLNGKLRVGSGSAGQHIMWSRSGLTAELVIGVDGYGNANNNEATIQSGTGRPLVFMTNGGERLRIQSTGQLLYSAASGDNTITSKRTNAAGSNGNYFFHLKATDNNDNVVGELGFHRDTAADNSRFIVNTRNSGGSSTERLRILADGEVLIGKYAWGSNLHPNDVNKVVITGPSPSGGGAAYHNTLMLEGSETSGAVDTGGALAFGGHDGNTNRNWANIWGMKENGTGSNTAGYLAFHTRNAGGNPTERIRITSTGRTYINTTSPIDGNCTVAIRGAFGASGCGVEIKHQGNQGAGRDFIRFYNINSAEAGSIEHNTSTSVQYLTSSDYRLKENIADIPDGIERLKLLKPRRFSWIDDPELGLRDGFIAHEVSPVIPHCVSGEKDAVKDNGKMQTQTMEYSQLTPLLTAALQEAIAEIETLKADVAALKSS